MDISSRQLTSSLSPGEPLILWKIFPSTCGGECELLGLMVLKASEALMNGLNIPMLKTFQRIYAISHQNCTWLEHCKGRGNFRGDQLKACVVVLIKMD